MINEIIYNLIKYKYSMGATENFLKSKLEIIWDKQVFIVIKYTILKDFGYNLMCGMLKLLTCQATYYVL